MFLIEFVKSIGTNEVCVGIATICSMVGFVLTIIVTMRTSKINRILKQNSIVSQYNKERIAFQKAFEGHRQSIDEDELKSNRILKNILKNVEEYRTKFSDILSTKEKISIYLFIRLLKKESGRVNYNTVSNYLATLSGRLAKKEKIIDG